MTTAKDARPGRRHPRRDILLDDLEVLEPDSPFRKKVEELRWFIAEHPRTLEQWTEADTDEFIRLAESDSLAVGLALTARNLNTTATSENPHRVFTQNDK